MKKISTKKLVFSAAAMLFAITTNLLKRYADESE